jgi:hypothetical protein
MQVTAIGVVVLVKTVLTSAKGLLVSCITGWKRVLCEVCNSELQIRF